jgi:hypothetical protein
MAEIWSNRCRIEQIEENTVGLSKHRWGFQYVVNHDEPF